MYKSSASEIDVVVETFIGSRLGRGETTSLFVPRFFLITRGDTKILVLGGTNISRMLVSVLAIVDDESASFDCGGGGGTAVAKLFVLLPLLHDERAPLYKTSLFTCSCGASFFGNERASPPYEGCLDFHRDVVFSALSPKDKRAPHEDFPGCHDGRVFFILSAADAGAESNP